MRLNAIPQTFFFLSSTIDRPPRSIRATTHRRTSSTMCTSYQGLNTSPRAGGAANGGRSPSYKFHDAPSILDDASPFYIIFAAIRRRVIESDTSVPLDLPDIVSGGERICVSIYTYLLFSFNGRATTCSALHHMEMESDTLFTINKALMVRDVDGGAPTSTRDYYIYYSTSTNPIDSPTAFVRLRERRSTARRRVREKAMHGPRGSCLRSASHEVRATARLLGRLLRLAHRMPRSQCSSRLQRTWTAGRPRYSSCRARRCFVAATTFFRELSSTTESVGRYGC